MLDWRRRSRPLHERICTKRGEQVYTRVSPLGCAYYTLVGITLCFLWITGMIFQQWRIETAGVSSPGTVVVVTPCYDRHGARLATVNLTLQFVDAHGAQHNAQTPC